MNHAVNDGSVYLLSSLFPVVLALYNLAVFQVGILVGVGYLVSVVGQPLVGRYSEGRDPRKLLALGISIVTASVFSFVLAADFFSILASLVLLRAGSSFFHPVGVSVVARTYQGASLERAMGFQSAFGNLGIFLVFISAAPIYLTLGWKATFILFALIGVADVLATLALLKIPQQAHPIVTQTADLHESGPRWIVTPVFFLVVAFISGACFALVLNYTNILLQSSGNLGVSAANAIVSGWIASAFLGAISTGRWPRVMRRASFLGLAFLLSAVTALIVALFPSYTVVVIPMLLLNGFALSATYPLTYSELSEFLATSTGTKGRSFGEIFSTQTVGGSILGLVSGYLSTLFGLPVAFFVSGLLSLFGFGVVSAWTRGARSRSLDHPLHLGIQESDPDSGPGRNGLPKVSNASLGICAP